MRFERGILFIFCALMYLRLVEVSLLFQYISKTRDIKDKFSYWNTKLQTGILTNNR